jgi:hypothetical protein
MKSSDDEQKFQFIYYQYISQSNNNKNTASEDSFSQRNRNRNIVEYPMTSLIMAYFDPEQEHLQPFKKFFPHSLIYLSLN